MLHKEIMVESSEIVREHTDALWNFWQLTCTSNGKYALKS
jgi:hypothetical protein